MADIDYGELFGVETSTDAETDNTQGANDQQSANADIGNNTDGAEGSNGGNTESQTETAGDDKAQSAEENSKYAAARRKAEAERDQKVAEAQAEADKYIDETFKALGLTNPYTNKPITTKAEYEEYKTQLDTEKQTRAMNKLKKGGLTNEEVDKFVNDLPAVKEARAKAEQAEKQAEQFRQVAMKNQIDEEIKRISEIDTSINNLADLQKSDSYQQVLQFVKMGHSLYDAYRFANIDKLAEGATAAAQRRTANNINGKAHLDRTTARGQGAQPVPADVKEQYRLLNPDMTDSEISAHYNKYINN